MPFKINFDEFKLEAPLFYHSDLKKLLKQTSKKYDIIRTNRLF